MTINDLLDVVDEALAKVKSESKETLGLTLMKADVEVAVAAEYTGKAGVKFEVVSVEMGAKIKRNSLHKISLAVIPASTIASMGSEANQLAAAILELAEAIKKTDKNKFTISKSSVEMKVVVSKEGTFQVFAGLSEGAEDTHSIKLEFQRDR